MRYKVSVFCAAAFALSLASWLIAAQASERLGKEADANEYASRAVNRLSELEQKWGSETYNTYLTRADVIHFRKQAEQVLKF